MVGTLTGFNDSGAKITIPNDSRGRPTVLYVFSQSCVWCQRSIPAVRALIQQGTANFRFIAVDLSAPFAPSKPYLSANNLAFEASFHPDPETRAHIGAEGTPTILVVDTTGGVEKVFNGALIGPTLKSAGHFFDGSQPTEGTAADVSNRTPLIKLPGCTQDGLPFSSGALICWQGKAYDCEAHKGWQEADARCTKGEYQANQKPIGGKDKF